MVGSKNNNNRQDYIETSKRLILCADDLNHASEINDGIGMALDAGVLTSMSVIVNRPLLPSTKEIVARKGKASLGLHFNLSRYHPCSSKQAVRTLTVNGRFEFGDNLEAFLTRAKTFCEEEVTFELENQIIQFKKHFGSIPSYIDSHHYVHSIQPVMRVFYNVCHRHGVPMRRPERRGCESTIILQDVPRCDKLVWLREAAGEKEIVDHLVNIKGGWTEFATHLRYRRESGATPALAFLVGEKFMKILRTHSIKMANYDEFRKIMCNKSQG